MSIAQYISKNFPSLDGSMINNLKAGISIGFTEDESFEIYNSQINLWNISKSEIYYKKNALKFGRGLDKDTEFPKKYLEITSKYKYIVFDDLLKIEDIIKDDHNAKIDFQKKFCAAYDVVKTIIHEGKPLLLIMK